jgi:hypothetical protein
MIRAPQITKLTPGDLAVSERFFPPALASRLPPSRVLRLVRACEEAVDWASAYGVSWNAFQGCTRADWLLWLLERFGLREPGKDRLFACWCVRHTPLPGGGEVWDLLTEPCSRRAVEVAERHARGAATDDERSEAWGGASWAAAALWATASPAESAAAAAAAWAVAREDMHQAAESAAAAAGSTPAALSAQADALRAIYGNPLARPARANAATEGEPAQSGA